MTAQGKNKIVVGSEEWCGLPGLGIPAIKARVDSGARTSSLHAFNIRGFKREGVSWVSYELHPIQHNRRVIVRCESPVVDRRVVKSSSGVGEKRYVIRTLLELSGQSWEIEITLANRDSMGYRMLLGRSAMVDRILVDPSAKALCGQFSKEEVQRLYGQAPNNVVGLKLGLLGSNPNLYSNKRLMEAAQERGHEIQFYDVSQCYMKLDPENPEIHYRRGHTLNDLDAVIPRIRPDTTDFGCALIRHFETIGVYSLNSSRAIATTRDKLWLLQTMIQHNLEVPVSSLARTPSDIGDLIDMVEGAPLLVKLLEGARGEGIVLADTDKSAESILMAFKSVGTNLLVQKFIREAGGSDLRLLVVDNKVVGAMERQAMVDEFGAGIRHGRSGTLARVTVAEKRLAVRAAKALGLKVAGVDLIRADKGTLVLDVHASPDLRLIEKATGKDLAGTLIHAVEKKLKWKRPLHQGAEHTTA